MTREEILTAIRGLAEKLGRVPSLEELHTQTAVSRRGVRTHFTMYTNALAELGMETGRNHRIPLEAPFPGLGGRGEQAAKAAHLRGICSKRPLRRKGIAGTLRKMAARPPFDAAVCARAWPGTAVAGRGGHGQGG